VMLVLVLHTAAGVALGQGEAAPRDLHHKTHQKKLLSTLTQGDRTECGGTLRFQPSGQLMLP
jgi:predicted GTPase